MLDQRRGRWADVVQMLYNFVVFAGKHSTFPNEALRYIFVLLQN